MKKTLLITIFLCLAVIGIAQPKSERRIYLWDVTLSMKGISEVGNPPNIYDDVKKFLIRDINNILDENTEIIVLPFQEKILETWREKSNAEGKKTIIQHINDFNNNNKTFTNIAGPIEEVKNNIISSDRYNRLIILTDGMQSKQFGGKESLLRIIRDWQTYHNIHNAYALYVMLTEESKDPEIIDKINITEGIDVITGGLIPDIIFLQPTELVSVNVIDDKTASIALRSNTTAPLPDNIKIRVKAQNNIINVDQIVTVQNKKIEFDLQFVQSIQTLQEKTIVPLKIELINQNEFQAIVQLTTENIKLELINKPEKTLKISIKK